MKLFYVLLLVLAALTGQAVADTVKYTIKSGDALSKIAKKYHTDVKTLKKLNGMKNDRLRAGKTIKVPYTNKNNKTVAYKIKSGDVLSKIANKYNTNVKTLQKMNGMTDTKIRVGKVIKVPSVKTTKIYRVKKKKSSRNFVASISSLPKMKIEKKKAEKKKSISWQPFEDFFASNGSGSGSGKIIDLAKTKLGKRYVWGAVGTKGTFDCSGFTKYCYKKNGIEIPRTSILQSKHGKFVKRNELKKGDLVFFDTSKRRKGYVNHVGIYLGDNKFIHASSAKKKVVITSLSKNFYSQRYMGARRP